MAKSNGTENTAVNLIGIGTTIQGDIKSDGDFRIDGMLIGSIESKGKIVVGNSGKVEGEIRCKNADVSGKVSAQIYVEQLLSLKATSDFSGDLKTGKLSIEPGAKFTGSCEMNSGDKNTPAKKAMHEKEKGGPK
ncbi:MAG: polymer-forming cytoskeletal protein [Bacteroidales bacterium]|nr:polymer-forming cytoskeletal protein [Bacteroidales bacterium]MCF8386292.1 polymer-forming cytoskeletal protein [Bacteroidales bacterium]MCF8398169.1 polymer-forming cytoskeletal protein [Bacteroidales bacterium]